MMNELTDTSLIQELRLRRWARKNYLAAEERTDSHWHPVVLDEMQSRDKEIESHVEASNSILAQFVPLEPTIGQLN
ncbi:MAG: hypothetical protein CMJ78_27655 [Planctomycetaceae bacterium]|nr:hypothetical protein [Planctomycetaceae bacterium]